MQEPEFQWFTTSDNWFKHQIHKAFDLIMYSNQRLTGGTTWHK